MSAVTPLLSQKPRRATATNPTARRKSEGKNEFYNVYLWMETNVCLKILQNSANDQSYLQTLLYVHFKML